MCFNRLGHHGSNGFSRLALGLALRLGGRMSVADWNSGGRIKVERAKEHIRQLEGAVRAFLARTPYASIPRVDREAGRVHYHAKVNEQPPLMLGALAGDARHNLRSALDVLWRNVWYPNGGGLNDKRIEFPIFDAIGGLANRYPLACQRGRNRRAVELVYEIKPYKGGNDSL